MELDDGDDNDTADDSEKLWVMFLCRMRQLMVRIVH